MAAHPHLRAENLFSCKGLNVVITGGGSGIGLMCTLGMVENGARVFITSRRADKLKDVARQYGGDGKQRGEIIPIECDVTKKESIFKMVAEVEKYAPNGIQCLINNAGMAGEGSRTDFKTSADATQMSKQLLKAEFEEWDLLLRTNLSSAYFVTAALLPLLQKGHLKGYQSQVIMLTSIGQFTKTSAAGSYAYCAGKAALAHLTRMLAYECVETKIRFNDLAPGVFPSEMVCGPTDSTHKSNMGDSTRGQETPSGRAGSENDMAACAVCLVSWGGVWLNGQKFYPDGGANITVPSCV